MVQAQHLKKKKDENLLASQHTHSTQTSRIELASTCAPKCTQISFRSSASVLDWVALFNLVLCVLVSLFTVCALDRGLSVAAAQDSP